MSRRHTGTSNIIDIAAEIRAETDKAWLLFDGDKSVWLPKSQAQDNENGTFAMPTWLAHEKGLT